MARARIIPVFVPHWGCPNECVFCDQKRISGSPLPASGAQVTAALEKVRAAGETGLELAFYGGSFTAVSPALQRELLEAAAPFLAGGTLASIRLSTRPDAVDADKLEMLKSYGVTTVELGAQSMDDVVHGLGPQLHGGHAIAFQHFQLVRVHRVGPGGQADGGQGPAGQKGRGGLKQLPLQSGAHRRETASVKGKFQTGLTRRPHLFQRGSHLGPGCGQGAAGDALLVTEDAFVRAAPVRHEDGDDPRSRHQCSSRARAARAAACSASFLLFPSPLAVAPSWSSTLAVKVLSWSGPDWSTME